MQGRPTENTLRLIATSEVYLLKIEQGTKLPALDFSETAIHDFCTTLRRRFGAALTLDTEHTEAKSEEGEAFERSVWQECVTFVQERVLKAKEVVKLRPNHIYFILSGKVALGKKIVDESEFIQGMEDRSVTALQTTSLFTIEISLQRRQ